MSIVSEIPIVNTVNMAQRLAARKTGLRYLKNSVSAEKIPARSQSHSVHSRTSKFNEITAQGIAGRSPRCLELGSYNNAQRFNQTVSQSLASGRPIAPQRNPTHQFHSALARGLSARGYHSQTQRFNDVMAQSMSGTRRLVTLKNATQSLNEQITRGLRIGRQGVATEVTRSEQFHQMLTEGLTNARISAPALYNNTQRFNDSLARHMSGIVQESEASRMALFHQMLTAGLTNARTPAPPAYNNTEIFNTSLVQNMSPRRRHSISGPMTNRSQAFNDVMAEALKARPQPSSERVSVATPPQGYISVDYAESHSEGKKFNQMMSAALCQRSSKHSLVL